MTKELFFKYLQGSCTEGEFEEVLAWMKEEGKSEAGRNLVREIWDELNEVAEPEAKARYNRVLDKIHHQINIEQKSSRVIELPKRKKQPWLALVTKVAAILLLPVLSLLIYTSIRYTDQFAANLPDMEVIAPAGSRVNLELGDGTKVWLNHGSELRYPHRFEADTRRVFLKGEAYFEVAHNSEVPFVVGTERLDVKATGTAFNVNAYEADERVEATLVEGQVIVYDRRNSNEIRTMSPNECLKFNVQSNSYSVESKDIEKYTSWKDGILIFRNDPMPVVAQKLGRWFNADVELSNELVKELTVTATFTNETLPQVLDLLTELLPMSFHLTPGEREADGSFSKQKVQFGFKNK